MSEGQGRVVLRRDLDISHAAFCETLPPELRAVAHELPYRLGLALSPDVPFSEVFAHEVTFAAPALFAEAMPRISPVKVRDAVLAHAFAVIDAFGTDRIEDRQIAATPDLLEILHRMREAQGRAAARLVADRDEADFGQVRRAMLGAIRAERRLMAERGAADFACYETIALGKTAIGTTASVALARAAGWTSAECATVSKTLSSVWLGMQYHDDVIDWEDDLRRQSAWAVILARGAGATIDPRDEEEGADHVRGCVLGSEILARMLMRSFRHFRAARRQAHALGARTLAAWAKTKEDHARFLAREEARNAGYAVRLCALAPWADELAS